MAQIDFKIDFRPILWFAFVGAYLCVVLSLTAAGAIVGVGPAVYAHTLEPIRVGAEIGAIIGVVIATMLGFIVYFKGMVK